MKMVDNDENENALDEENNDDDDLLRLFVRIEATHDTLLLQVVFDSINSKLARELHEKKKEMALIIEQSNIAYEVT